MAGRPCLLDEKVQSALIDSIGKGAFDWVAAEAAGIGRRTFYDWLKRGESGEEPFARLLAAVRQARARARAEAERELLNRDPGAWLTKGPGRERPSEPGWTAPRQVHGAAGEAEGGAEQVLRAALDEVPLPGEVD